MSSSSSELSSSRPTVHSRVALALLQGLKDQDLPQEVLDDENLTLTLPRRLGLSNVVETQIRRFREDARKGRRITDREIADLIALVGRRPDAAEVFLRVGAELHGTGARTGWRRLMPRRLAHALARRRTRQRLRGLFGRRMISSAGAPFRLEAVDDLLTVCDSKGDACAIITGLAGVELSRVGSEGQLVLHSQCRARGDERCIWDVEADQGSPVADQARPTAPGGS